MRAPSRSSRRRQPLLSTRARSRDARVSGKIRTAHPVATDNHPAHPSNEIARETSSQQIVAQICPRREQACPLLARRFVHLRNELHVRRFDAAQRALNARQRVFLVVAWLIRSRLFLAVF